MKTSLIFIMGVGMGYVLGLLLAPESGKVTRMKIREEADRMIDKALAKKHLNDLKNDGVVTTVSTAPKKRSLTLTFW